SRNTCEWPTDKNYGYRQGRTRCFRTIFRDPDITTEHTVPGIALMEHFITMFDQEHKEVGFKPRAF
ncbi:hypothetical protein X801_05233, partial [Opisthorchis viverrini]